MNLYKFFILCFLSCACLAKEEDVLELTDENFGSGIAEHETALVMFYAPWCGHCKKLKPQYEKAAEDLNRQKSSIRLIKIDCSGPGKETCDKHDVTAYPNLKVFRYGEFSEDYGGSREATGIVNYMKSYLQPNSKLVGSVAGLDQLLKAEKNELVVGFFEKDSELKTAFLKLAGDWKGNVRFAHSANKDVLKEFGTNNGIILFRPHHLTNKFEVSHVTYTGTAVTGEIKSFIKKNFHGLVGHRKPINKDHFQHPLVVVYFNVDYEKNPKGTNYWRNRILQVAERYKLELTFAFSAKNDFPRDLSDVNIDDNDDKPIVLAFDNKNSKYLMSDLFTVEALDNFVKNFLAGKLKAHLKSEPLPKTNDKPVKIAVAMNFDDVVINNGKDTLIEFYAPWCGHCKKLAPIFDELGEKLKNEDVAVVKMDATANEVPERFAVDGYPAVYWLLKGKKNDPVPYEDERELDDFIKYIAKHATSELKGFDRDGKPKTEKTEL